MPSDGDGRNIQENQDNGITMGHQENGENEENFDDLPPLQEVSDSEDEESEEVMVVVEVEAMSMADQTKKGLKSGSASNLAWEGHRRP